MQQKEEQFQQVLSQSTKLQSENEALKLHLEGKIRKVAELEQSSSLVAQQLKEKCSQCGGRAPF